MAGVVGRGGRQWSVVVGEEGGGGEEEEERREVVVAEEVWMGLAHLWNCARLAGTLDQSLPLPHCTYRSRYNRC
jgi:hypothetical protein